jgi:hypothetical protein
MTHNTVNQRVHAKRLADDGVKDWKGFKLSVGWQAEGTIGVREMFDLLLIECLTDDALSNLSVKQNINITHITSGLLARCKRAQAAVMELGCWPAISKAIIMCYLVVSLPNVHGVCVMD